MNIKNVLNGLKKWLPNLAIYLLLFYAIFNTFVLEFYPNKEFNKMQIKKAFYKMSVIEKLRYAEKGDVVEFKNGSSFIIYRNRPQIYMFDRCDSIKKYAMYSTVVSYSSVSEDVANVFIRRVDVDAWSEAIYRRMQIWNMGLLNR